MLMRLVYSAMVSTPIIVIATAAGLGLIASCLCAISLVLGIQMLGDYGHD